MPLIVTPRYLVGVADFYQQLGSMYQAGVGVVPSLKSIQGSAKSRVLRGPIQTIIRQVESGQTLAESMKSVPGWLPQFDGAMLDAGEQSGRLDATFLLLADFYRRRVHTAREVLNNVSYPLFVLHFAVFLLPFPTLFRTGDIGAYLIATLGFLVPAYAIAATVIYAAQARRGIGCRAFIEGITRWIPLLGAARFSLAIGRLSTALAALISAGVPMVRAWELAAQASGSVAVWRVVRQWRRPLEEGMTPADLLGQAGLFPEYFVKLYRTGEVTGSLDDTLDRLGDHYLEEGNGKLGLFAQWFPRLVYLIVAGYVAFQVISFWMGYFDQISEAGGF